MQLFFIMRYNVNYSKNSRSQYPHRLYIFNFKRKIVYIIEILNYNENNAASGWYSF